MTERESLFTDAPPQMAPMPKLLRDRVREGISDPKVRELFAGIEAWEDDLIAAFNLCATAADRMAAALEAIEETPYGKFANKGDYAAFIRDLASNGRFPK